jgi:hypothetical protein
VAKALHVSKNQAKVLRVVSSDLARVRIVELCAAAAQEEDGERLIGIIQELLTLLPEDPTEAMVLLSKSEAGAKLVSAN